MMAPSPGTDTSLRKHKTFKPDPPPDIFLGSLYSCATELEEIVKWPREERRPKALDGIAHQAAADGLRGERQANSWSS